MSDDPTSGSHPSLTDEAIGSRVEELLAAMTPAEKAGQLTQYFYFGFLRDSATAGTVEGASASQPLGVEAALARGEAGSLLFVTDPAEINRLQRLAIEGNRHGIPVLFGFDVIHGLRTIFPVPIAMAASWDPGHDRARPGGRRPRGARGRHPLDVRADGRHRPRPAVGTDHRGRRRGPVPRRGRRRRPGARLPGRRARRSRSAIIAGPKHFAGYGAALGGRDYDEVNLSDSELWNVYFPPFEAAIDAGAGNVMTAYMDLNGVPATGNQWLFTEVLRDTWGFEGFVVSDANAVRNLVTHGFAADLTDAGARAVTVGRRPRDGDRRPRLRATCPRRVEAGAVDVEAGRRLRPAGAGGQAAAGPVRRSRTSTRTAPARCSPTRPTARWPGSRRSGRRCCCATRATCCRSTPAASARSPSSVRSPTPSATRSGRGCSTSTSTRPSPCSRASAPAVGDAVSGRPTPRASGRRSGCSRRCSTCSAATRRSDPEGFDDEAELQRAVDLAAAVGRRGRRGRRVAEHDRRGRVAVVAGAARPPARAAAGGRRDRHTGRAAGDERAAARPALGRASTCRRSSTSGTPAPRAATAVANLLFGDVSPGGKLPVHLAAHRRAGADDLRAHPLARAARTRPGATGTRRARRCSRSATA